MKDEQMQGYFERTIEYGISQCDISGKWKLSSVLEALQDTANEHCQLLHLGRDELAQKLMNWVLFRTCLQIDRWPLQGETVLVKTFTKGSTFKFFPRYFTIEDKTGHQICRAGSLWMIVNKNLKSTLTAEESGIFLPEVKGITPPIVIPTKSKTIDGGVVSSLYMPVFTDFDLNRHVNNTRYADWLYNALGLRELTDKEITYVSIDYNYEVSLNIEIENKLICKDNEFQFVGINDERLLFCIYGIMRDQMDV